MTKEKLKKYLNDIFVEPDTKEYFVDKETALKLANNKVAMYAQLVVIALCMAYCIYLINYYGMFVFAMFALWVRVGYIDAFRKRLFKCRRI